MRIADLAYALDPVLLMQRLGLDPDSWQRDLLWRAVRAAPANQELLLCSRQSGKSSTTAVLALHEALYRPPALVLMLSPSLRQSQELFFKFSTFYNELGQPVPAREASALRLTLENGSRIIALPGSEATIRGYSGVTLLLIDEASRVGDPLYFSVRPMLAVSGGRLIAMTTPYGKRGWLYHAWTEGGSHWHRTKVTAYDCPRISREFLEQEKLALGPRWYRQEYEVSFEETTDQVFSTESVMRALSDEVQPLFDMRSDIDRYITGEEEPWAFTSDSI